MSNEPKTALLGDLPPMSELVPLGYLYLLVLGIVNQSLFYGLLGVNFLAWSDALDVLISPIALLTGDLKLLVTVVVLVLLLYPYTKSMHSISRKKKSQRGVGEETKQAPLMHAWLTYSALVMVFGFIGFGIGSGSELRGRLAAGEAEIDHRVEFHDGRTVQVELVGKNTGFLFYFSPGDTALSIVPLADNVHLVQRIEPAAATKPAPAQTADAASGG